MERGGGRCSSLDPVGKTTTRVDGERLRGLGRLPSHTEGTPECHLTSTGPTIFFQKFQPGSGSFEAIDIDCHRIPKARHESTGVRASFSLCCPPGLEADVPYPLMIHQL